MKTELSVDSLCFKTNVNFADFWGMARYYRGFRRYFATVVVSLTDLLSTRVPFVWSEKCQEAFNNAKMLLATAPLLLAPNVKHPFSNAVDASESGAGAVLTKNIQYVTSLSLTDITELTLLLRGRHLL